MRILSVLFALLLSSQAIAEERYTLPNGTQVAPLDVFQECDACPEMIVLPLGDFMMGGPLGESTYAYVVRNDAIVVAERDDPGVRPNERPVHHVTMDIPVAMGRNEVTFEQWMMCVDAGGCRHTPRDTYRRFGHEGQFTYRGTYPVMDISYNDITEYVAWLNELVGQGVYRLPTEAEWEYAARAGTQTPFAQGEWVHTDQVNYNGQAVPREPGAVYEGLAGRGGPVPVETLDAANAWGLRHMSGNVMERTASCSTDTYLGWSTASEWQQQSIQTECKRATRGGSYQTSMDFQRVALRGGAREGHRSKGGGFRVLRELN